jgi:hypothetical protein
MESMGPQVYVGGLETNIIVSIYILLLSVSMCKSRNSWDFHQSSSSFHEMSISWGAESTEVNSSENTIILEQYLAKEREQVKYETILR